MFKGSGSDQSKVYYTEKFLNKAEPAIGHLSTCEDLPAEHPICPHVAFRGESGEVQNLTWIGF